MEINILLVLNNMVVFSSRLASVIATSSTRQPDSFPTKLLPVPLRYRCSNVIVKVKRAYCKSSVLFSLRKKLLFHWSAWMARWAGKGSKANHVEKSQPSFAEFKVIQLALCQIYNHETIRTLNFVFYN